jgi:hypothetical protein
MPLLPTKVEFTIAMNPFSLKMLPPAPAPASPNLPGKPSVPPPAPPAAAELPVTRLLEKVLEKIRTEPSPLL